MLSNSVTGLAMPLYLDYLVPSLQPRTQGHGLGVGGGQVCWRGGGGAA